MTTFNKNDTWTW